MATDAELAALYEGRLRELAAAALVDKRLEEPQIQVTVRSRICGSTLTLDLDFDGDRIERLGFRARACSLGTAATAVLARLGPGQTIAQVAAAGDALRALLTGEDEVVFPPGWELLEIFAAAVPFPGRQDSVLLPFDAVAKAAEQAGSTRPKS